jgi:hypothetical protein
MEVLNWMSNHVGLTIVLLVFIGGVITYVVDKIKK